MGFHSGWPAEFSSALKCSMNALIWTGSGTFYRYRCTGGNSDCSMVRLHLGSSRATSCGPYVVPGLSLTQASPLLVSKVPLYLF